MHSTDYQKLALRTEVTPPFISTTVGRGESEANRLGRLLHAAIGMVTEIGELEEQAAAGGHDRVNVIEEIGDIYWYVNLAIDACGANWDDDRLRLQAYEASLEAAIYRMVCTAGQLMDIYKKHLIYGKPFTFDNASCFSAGTSLAAQGRHFTRSGRHKQRRWTGTSPSCRSASR